MPDPAPPQASARRHAAVVALGAYLGDRSATLEQAVQAIASDIGEVEARSAWLETEAMIHPDDPATSYPAFLNGAVRVLTPLPPSGILERLHRIEARLGRDRGQETERWRPRLVDLDLVAVDDLVEEGPGLRLPHPEMHRRSFVLAPFCEVWPDWRHPLLGRTARELLAELEEAQR